MPAKYPLLKTLASTDRWTASPVKKRRREERKIREKKRFLSVFGRENSPQRRKLGETLSDT